MRTDTKDTSRKPGSAGAQARDRLTKGFRGIFFFLFSFSGLINILALTGSFYMMQVYDRAIPSQNVPTLLTLSLLALGLYAFQGLFETIRSQILVRIGSRLDQKLAPLAHKVAIDMPRFGFSTSEALERSRDVDTVRGFLGSQGPMAFFDLPWMPVYLAFVYLLHPFLGALVIAGAVVLIIIAIVSELALRKLSQSVQKSGMVRNALADSNARNAEVLRAMGFASRAVKRFAEANREHVLLQTKANDVSGTLGAISRILRLVLQSATLGMGAYLVIEGQMSSGAIIACSITASRALAPVDLAIGNWKNMVQARNAWNRLKDTVVALEKEVAPMQLPQASQSFKVEKLTVAAPSSGRVLLSEVSFELKAGQALGIIGPSGGGKTTLVRAMTGIWPPLRGSVRIDDAELVQWSEESLGTMIGYLPQDVSLLDGTIEQNISRFDGRSDSKSVVAAARMAGIHEMIVRLPEGYQTEVGPQGITLSAGQRQRIGLARALYGNPFAVIMDEPNSNLDSEGELALTQAIRSVRDRGGVAIVVAHRPSALASVDLVGVVQQGKLIAFGAKDEILGNNQPRPAVAGPQPQARPRQKPKAVVAGGVS